MTVVFKGIVAYNICRLIGRGHSSAQNGVRQGSVHLEILSQLLFPIQSPGLLVTICTPSSRSPGAAVSWAFSLGSHTVVVASPCWGDLQATRAAAAPGGPSGKTQPHTHIKQKKGRGSVTRVEAQRGKNRRLRIAKGSPQECNWLSRGAAMNTSH